MIVLFCERAEQLAVVVATKSVDVTVEHAEMLRECSLDFTKNFFYKF